MQGGGPPGCEVWISSSVTCPVAQASQACSIPAGAGELSRDLLLGLAWGDMRGQPWQGGWVPADARGPSPVSAGFCRGQALTGTPAGHHVSPRGSAGALPGPGPPLSTSHPAQLPGLRPGPKVAPF